MPGAEDRRDNGERTLADVEGELLACMARLSEVLHELSARYSTAIDAVPRPTPELLGKVALLVAALAVFNASHV